MEGLTQISVFMENKPGVLFDLLNILSDNNINIRALNIAETSEHGVLRLIVDNDKIARDVIVDNGYIATQNIVFAIPVSDKPGGLKNLIEKIANDGINIEYMYSIFGKENGLAYMIISTSENEALVNTLEKNNIKTLSTDDLIKNL